MGQTARKAAVAALVVVGVVVLALALWKLKLVIALLFAGFIISAAMRPGIEAMHARGIPRAVGLTLHYVVFAGLLALALWLAVPRALDQVTAAVDNLPQTRREIGNEAQQSSGIKQEILQSLQRHLKEVPSGGKVFETVRTVGMTAFEIAIGIFFMFAVAGYWIFERDRAMKVVTELLPRPKRKVVRDTWLLIDLKLGAYVRGMALIVLIVATTLSLLFWAIGLPYWLLIGCFAGLVEIVPVIGPIAAGALAIGVGLTQSVHLAVLALIVVVGVRLAQDYLVNPRVMGSAVGMSPLVVIFSASAVVFLFGGFAVLLSVPLAAVVVTLVDVVVRNKNPAEEETPTVLFPAKEAEHSSDPWAESESALSRHLRDHPDVERALLESPHDELNGADLFLRASVLEERYGDAAAVEAFALADERLYNNEVRDARDAMLARVVEHAAAGDGTVADVAPDAGALLRELRRVGRELIATHVFFRDDDEPNLAAARELGLDRLATRGSALAAFSASGWSVTVELELERDVRADPTPVSELVPGVSIDGLPVVPASVTWCALVAR